MRNVSGQSYLVMEHFFRTQVCQTQVPSEARDDKTWGLSTMFDQIITWAHNAWNLSLINSNLSNSSSKKNTT